jgi:TolA-binding protein
MRTCATLLFGFLLSLSAVAQVSGEQDQIDFANGLFNRGFFSEAAGEYTRYIEAYPQGTHLTTAYRRLGDAAFAAGAYEQALKAFDASLERVDDAEARWQIRLSRGQALYFLERYDEALEALKPCATSEAPPETRGAALYYLGQSARQVGKASDAIAWFRTLVDSFPGHRLSPYARYQYGFMLIAQEDFEGAAVQFSELAASDADAELRAEARYRAAEVYDRMGWYDAAVGAYEDLQKNYPDSPYVGQAAYGFGWALYHAGRLEEAAQAARQYLKQETATEDNSGMRYLLGNALQALQQYGDAEQAFQTVREAAPESEYGRRALYKLAWVNYLQQDTENAREQVTAFLQAYPDNPLAGDAAFLLGTLEVEAGNYERAQQQFVLVAENHPESSFGPEALFKSGECLMQLDLYDQAAGRFDQLLDQYPDSALAARGVLRSADAHLKAGNYEEAVRRYQQALASEGLGAERGDAQYRLALAQQNAGAYGDAAATFKALLKDTPDSSHAAEAHFRIAEHQLRDGRDPVQAIAAYEAALEAAPEGPFAGRALRGLALARYEQQDLDQAADQFLRVMREYPETELNEQAYIWTGGHLAEADRWEDAQVAYESLLKTIPDYPNPERVLYRIAECEAKRGRTDEAIGRYEAVVEAAPTSSKALEAKFQMATLYDEKGDTEKALALYQEASTANLTDIAAKAHFRLGELYEGQEAWEKAARSYMRVAILYLDETLSPKALYRAGQSFGKAGMSEQAQKAYQEIVSDFPESDVVTQARDALAAAQGG